MVMRVLSVQSSQVAAVSCVRCIFVGVIPCPSHPFIPVVIDTGLKFSLLVIEVVPYHCQPLHLQVN